MRYEEWIQSIFLNPNRRRAVGFPVVTFEEYQMFMQDLPSLRILSSDPSGEVTGEPLIHPKGLFYIGGLPFMLDRYADELERAISTLARHLPKERKQ